MFGEAQSALPGFLRTSLTNKQWVERLNVKRVSNQTRRQNSRKQQRADRRRIRCGKAYRRRIRLDNADRMRIRRGKAYRSRLRRDEEAETKSLAVLNNETTVLQGSLPYRYRNVA